MISATPMRRYTSCRVRTGDLQLEKTLGRRRHHQFWNQVFLQKKNPQNPPIFFFTFLHSLMAFWWSTSCLHCMPSQNKQKNYKSNKIQNYSSPSSARPPRTSSSNSPILSASSATLPEGRAYRRSWALLGSRTRRYLPEK